MTQTNPIQFHGVNVALRLDANGIELCTLLDDGEPEAKLLTLGHDGIIGLAEHVHPDMVPFVRLEGNDTVQVAGRPYFSPQELKYLRDCLPPHLDEQFQLDLLDKLAKAFTAAV